MGIWLGTGRNPLAVAKGAVYAFQRKPLFLAFFTGMFGLLVVNWVENRFEEYLALWIPWDYTPFVARFGTDWLLATQRLEWAPLTDLLVYVYVILFPVLPLISIFIYAYHTDLRAVRILFRNFVNTYLVALPFYLFAPVREAWTEGLGVRFLIPSLYPGFEEQFRPWSALDNAFPSLHTSLAITVALVAWRSGYRRFALVLGAIAVVVAFSTLYLGVHWILDMIGGVVLAFGVAAFTKDRAPTRVASSSRRCPSSLSR
jgi:membrane-associated phospholipid phosphatase